MKAALSLAALLALFAFAEAPAASANGGPTTCVGLHMRRGTDTITAEGRLTRQGGAYCYRLSARAGQTLTWSLRGPATRQVITYPDGHADGPGIPGSIPLPQTGSYLFTVSPNLMAEGAYGRFWLTLTIH